MKTRAAQFRWLLCGLFALLSTVAQAHPLAPALLEITAQPESQFNVVWRVDLRSQLQPPSWPADCKINASDQRIEMRSRELRLSLKCPHGLAGRQIDLASMADARSAVLLRYIDLQGRETQNLLSQDESGFELPQTPGRVGLNLDYSKLGIKHIFSGLDHLFLVLGLFLLARRWQQLLLLVTAFTLGHSLTLSLASLGWLTLPSTPVEIAIALSLVWLALDLVKQRRAGRRHAAIFIAFGLVHGLGFAGALQELGLPRQSRLPALLSFNLGIEVGQICFLALLAAGRSLIQHQAVSLAHPLRWIGIYSLGSLGAFWSLSRGLTLLG